MKKKLASIISLFFASIVLVGSVIFGYYSFTKANPGVSLSISNVSFTLNGEPSADNTHVFSLNKMQIGDGYDLELNLAVTGNYTAAYASQYGVTFELVGANNDLARAIEVYQKINNEYEYIGMLDKLVDQDITGFLGVNDSDTYNYKLVYAEGAGNYYENKSFTLQLAATSDIVATTTENFPYYFLNVTDEEETGGMDDVFASLSQTNQIGSVEGRIIVLLADMQIDSAVTFNKMVGLDLNGHHLVLNNNININYTIGSGTHYDDVMITDSKGVYNVTGSGKININATDDVMKIEDGFTANAGSYINADITASGVTHLASIFQERVNKITEDTLSATSNYSFDIVEDYRYYTSNSKLTVNEVDGSYTSKNNSTYVFSIAVPTYTQNYNVLFEVTGVTSSTTIPIDGDFVVIGSSSADIVNLLLNSLPTTINSSVYLPTYLPYYNAHITWVSSNNNIINKNGEFLANGLAPLSSWLNQSFDLGAIVEINGNTTSKYKTLAAEIVSPEDKTEMIYDFKQLLFSNHNDGVNDGDIVSTNLADTLVNKYNDTLANILEDKFGVTSIGELCQKLGLQSITMTGIDNNDYITKTNVTDTDNGYSYFSLEMVADSINTYTYDVNIIFTYKVSASEETTTTVTLSRVLTVGGNVANTQATDASKEIRPAFVAYSASNQSTTNAYNTSFFVLDTTSNGDEITYSIPAEYSSYVRTRKVNAYTGGSLYESNDTNPHTEIYVLPGSVPQGITEVHVDVTVGGQQYDISFDCMGIYHNTSEDIENTNLYTELLAKFDVNHDNYITYLEAQADHTTSLNCQGKSITSIKGIEYFPNITAYNFKNNSIVNISYLENMSQMTSLDLTNNLITDISSLAYLDQLVTLKLGNNTITDVSPLKYLSSLRYLYLENNKVVSFEDLQDMTLTQLDIYGNTNSSGTYTAGSSNNQYYATLLCIKNNGIVIHHDAVDTTSVFTPNSSYLVAAEIMKRLELLEETYETLYLPTTYTISGTTYNITYACTSDYINFTVVDGSVTATQVTRPVVDTSVDITIQVGIGSEGIQITRPFVVRVLQSPEAADIAWIEVANDGTHSYVIKATDLIPDANLLSYLFIQYNTNDRTNDWTPTRSAIQIDTNGNIISSSVTIKQDKTISAKELASAANTVLDLSNKGIQDLTGLRWFTSVITSLDLTGNTLMTDANGYGQIQEISYLQKLKTLTLAGQLYDFEMLIHFIVNQPTDARYVSETFTITDAVNGNETITQRQGISTLTSLDVSGCYRLDDDATTLALYHVYRCNKSVGIKIVDSSTIWNPYAIPLAQEVAKLTSSYAFREVNDSLSFDSSYAFYFYDDIDPIYFTPTVGDITGYAGEAINAFTKGTTAITMTSLVGYNDTLYSSVTLAATTSNDNRNISSVAKTTWQLELRAEYNWNIIYDDTARSGGDSTDANNGKRIDEIFYGQGVKTVVMKSIGDSIYTYVVNGTTSAKETALNTAGIYDNHDGTYTVTKTKFAAITSTGSGGYDLVLNGAYDAPGDSPAAGLQYLTSITKVNFLRDATLGDGSALVNLTKILTRYAGIDFSTFSTYLPNLTYLELLNPYYLILGSYEPASNGFGVTTVIDSYMKWMPNLSTFKTTNSKTPAVLYNFTFLLAYSYLPDTAVEDIPLANNNLYVYNGETTNDFALVATWDSTENMWIKNGGGEFDKATYIEENSLPATTKFFRKMPANKFGTVALDYVSGGTQYYTTKLMVDLLHGNRNNTSAAYSYSLKNSSYDPDVAVKKFTPTQLAEYKEFAGLIKDYGLKINGSYYCNSNSHTYSSISLTMPSYTDSYITTSVTNAQSSNYYNVNANNYRKFSIKWYAYYSGNVNDLQTVLGSSLLTDTNIENATQVVGGVYRVLLDVGTHNEVIALTSLSYDTYFVLEAVIGWNITGATERSYVYPLTLSGTNKQLGSDGQAVANSSTTVNGASISLTATSYADITDETLRLMMFFIYGSQATTNSASPDRLGVVPVAASTMSAKSLSIQYSSSQLGTFSITNKGGTTTNLTLPSTMGTGFNEYFSTCSSLQGINLVAPCLEGLTMVNMGITEITPLANLGGLSTIKLNKMNIGSLAPLKDLEHLSSVEICYAPLVDFYSSSNNHTYLYNSLGTLTYLNLNQSITFDTADLLALRNDVVSLGTNSVGGTSHALTLGIYNTTCMNGSASVYDTETVKLLDDISKVYNATTLYTYSDNSANKIDLTKTSDYFDAMKAIITTGASTNWQYDWYGVGGGYDNLPTNVTTSYVNTLIDNTANNVIAYYFNELLTNMKFTSTTNSNLSIYQPVTVKRTNISGTRKIIVGANEYTVSDFDQELFNYLYSLRGSTGVNAVNNDIEITSSFTSIEISSNYGIKSLKGLELLPGLTSISITNNPISSIDVSQVSSITSLTIGSTVGVESLIGLTKCSSLTTLDLHQIEGIDYSKVDTGNSTSTTFMSYLKNRSTAMDISINNTYNRVTYASGSYSSLDGGAMNYASTITDLNSLFSGTISYWGSWGANYSSSHRLGIFFSFYRSGSDYTYHGAVNVTNLSLMTKVKAYHYYMQTGNATTFSFDTNNGLLGRSASINGATLDTYANILKYAANLASGIYYYNGTAYNYRTIIKDVYQSDSIYLPEKLRIDCSDSSSTDLSYTWSIDSFGSGAATLSGYLLSIGAKATGSGYLKMNGEANGNAAVLTITSKTISTTSSVFAPPFYIQLENGILVPTSSVFKSGRLVYYLMGKASTSVPGADINTDRDNILTRAEIDSYTTATISNSGITSLEGMQIFKNITSFSNTDTGFNDITPLSNMRLTKFSYTSVEQGNFIISDWSPLFNSKDTLTEFYYTCDSSDKLMADCFSFLMSCPNLQTVSIGLTTGMEKMQSFEQFAAWMYIYRGVTVTYNSNIATSDTAKNAANIFNSLSAEDYTMSYHDNFLLTFDSDYNESTNQVSGTLPTYITAGTSNYKLMWSSMSTYVDIVITDASTPSNVVSYEDYEKINDFDTYSTYTITATLRNREYNQTTLSHLVAKVDLGGESKYVVGSTSQSEDKYYYCNSNNTYSYKLLADIINTDTVLKKVGTDYSYAAYDSTNSVVYKNLYTPNYFEKMYTIDNQYCSDSATRIEMRDGYVTYCLPALVKGYEATYSISGTGYSLVSTGYVSGSTTPVTIVVDPATATSGEGILTYSITLDGGETETGTSKIYFNATAASVTSVNTFNGNITSAINGGQTLTTQQKEAFIATYNGFSIGQKAYITNAQRINYETLTGQNVHS